MTIQIGSGINIGGAITIGGVATPVANLLVDLDASDPLSYPGSGSTWFDLSVNNNDFTLVGTAPYTANGQQSYFTFSAGIAQGPAVLPNQAYTKVAIVRTATGNFGNIISGDNANQHAFWGSAGQFLQAGHNGAWSTVLNPIAVPINQWFFAAVSFNTATGWRLYLNNLSVITNPDTTAFAANPAVVEIGGYDGNYNNLNGDIAIAQIYDAVLSDFQIAALYSSWQSRFSL